MKTTHNGLSIILDGIDECDDRHLLLENFRSIALLENVKFVFFSRVERFIEDELVGHYGAVSINVAENNGQDIRTYVNFQVTNYISARPHLRAKEEYLKDRLEKGAEAMFQWVKLKMDSFNNNGHEERDVDRILDSVPSGLDSAYEQTFDRVSRSDGFMIPRVKTALQWLVCAMRPLTLRELRLLIDLSEEYGSMGTELEDSLEIYVRCAEEVE